MLDLFKTPMLPTDTAFGNPNDGAVNLIELRYRCSGTQLGNAARAMTWVNLMGQGQWDQCRPLQRVPGRALRPLTGDFTYAA